MDVSTVCTHLKLVQHLLTLVADDDVPGPHQTCRIRRENKMKKRTTTTKNNQNKNNSSTYKTLDP